MQILSMTTNPHWPVHRFHNDFTIDPLSNCLHFTTANVLTSSLISCVLDTFIDSLYKIFILTYRFQPEISSVFHFSPISWWCLSISVRSFLALYSCDIHNGSLSPKTHTCNQPIKKFFGIYIKQSH